MIKFEGDGTPNRAIGVLTYEDDHMIVPISLVISYPNGQPTIKVAYAADYLDLSKGLAFLKITHTLMRVLRRFFVGDENKPPTFDPSNKIRIPDFLSLYAEDAFNHLLSSASQPKS
jgi:hypothetical protein